MKKKEEELWIRALKDDGKAFRKLGKRFLEQGRKELAGLCLQKAIERGDEKKLFPLSPSFLFRRSAGG